MPNVTVTMDNPLSQPMQTPNGPPVNAQAPNGTAIGGGPGPQSVTAAKV